MERLGSYTDTDVPAVAADFWERTTDMSVAVQKYASDLLDNIGNAVQIREVKDSIQGAITWAGRLQEDLKPFLSGHDSGAVSDQVNGIFQVVLDDLKDTFPPTDQAPSHAQREAMTRAVLEKAESALLKFARERGMTEAQAKRFRQNFAGLKPYVERLIIATGECSSFER